MTALIFHGPRGLESGRWGIYVGGGGIRASDVIPITVVIPLFLLVGFHCTCSAERKMEGTIVDKEYQVQVY